MDTYDQPFKTYQEQVEILKSKGLIIDDDSYAIRILSSISYYDLITCYRNIFMDETSHFINGLAIEDIVSFAFIDKAIQSLIIKYSLLVENIFKTRLAYTMAKDFGVEIGDYLDSNHYKQTYGNPNSVLSYLDVQTECIQTYNNNSISNNPTVYYKKHYNHVPPWILLKNLSFSNAINLFKLLKPKQMEDIVNSIIDNPNIPYNDRLNLVLCSLNAIRNFRNVAVHNLHFIGLRIDEKMKLAPTIMSKVYPGGHVVKKEKKKIPSQEKRYLKGIYGVLLAILIYIDVKEIKAIYLKDVLAAIDNVSSNSSNTKLGLSTYLDAAQVPNDIDTRFKYLLINI